MTKIHARAVISTVPKQSDDFVHFKMQDMYSSNLSGIHTITSFSKRLPWG